jgi:hypothetical protein
MSAPRYIYIAHPLTDLPAQYLANVAAISRCSRRLIERGFCPINPAGDMLEGLMSDTPLTIEQYQLRSLQLLDLLRGREGAALLVLTTCHMDGRESAGVWAEIHHAEACGIPVVWGEGEL